MTRRTPLDLDNERQSLRLSNTSRERRIAAEHARVRAAIEDARYLLRGAGYHVIAGGDAIDTSAISSVLGDWYHAEIRSIANAIIRDVRVARGIEAPRPREYVTDEITRESDEDEIRQWVSERVDEDTDGHEYVIYTYKAKLVLLASDNESAYEDEIGDSTGATVEARACMAMRADVMGVLSAREDEWLTCEIGSDKDPDPDPTPPNGDPDFDPCDLDTCTTCADGDRHAHDGPDDGGDDTSETSRAYDAQVRADERARGPGYYTYPAGVSPYLVESNPPCGSCGAACGDHAESEHGEADACPITEPCAAASNGMSECDADHHARGVACGVCAPVEDE